MKVIKEACGPKKTTVSVVCTQAVNAGDIKLVPNSMNLRDCLVATTLPSSSVLISERVPDTDRSVFIASSVELGLRPNANGKKQFVVPFWIVEKAEDSKDENLEVSSVVVPITVGAAKLDIKIPVLQNKRKLSEGAVLEVQDSTRESMRKKAKK